MWPLCYVLTEADEHFANQKKMFWRGWLVVTTCINVDHIMSASLCARREENEILAMTSEQCRLLQYSSTTQSGPSIWAGPMFSSKAPELLKPLPLRHHSLAIRPVTSNKHENAACTIATSKKNPAHAQGIKNQGCDTTRVCHDSPILCNLAAKSQCTFRLGPIQFLATWSAVLLQANHFR